VFGHPTSFQDRIQVPKFPVQLQYVLLLIIIVSVMGINLSQCVALEVNIQSNRRITDLNFTKAADIIRFVFQVF
jgi:hypothetical protein